MEYYYKIKGTIFDEGATEKLNSLEWSKVPLINSINIEISDFEIGKKRNYFYLFEIYEDSNLGPGLYLFLLRNDKRNGKQRFLFSLSNQLPNMKWIDQLLSTDIKPEIK